MKCYLLIGLCCFIQESAFCSDFPGMFTFMKWKNPQPPNTISEVVVKYSSNTLGDSAAPTGFEYGISIQNCKREDTMRVCVSNIEIKSEYPNKPIVSAKDVTCDVAPLEIKTFKLVGLSGRPPGYAQVFAEVAFKITGKVAPSPEPKKPSLIIPKFDSIERSERVARQESTTDQESNPTSDSASTFWTGKESGSSKSGSGRVRKDEAKVREAVEYWKNP